jgi:uncharacterized membrane protein YbhN (UPF0104 family)
MFRKYYPPVRYVFYPLYWWMRRRKLPIAAAYLSVWIVSGLLHGALLLAFGHPVGAGGFFILFTGLGLAGVAAIEGKHRSRGRN